MEVKYISKFWLDFLVDWILYQLCSSNSLDIGLSYLLATIDRERHIMVDWLLNRIVLKSDSFSLCL